MFDATMLKATFASAAPYDAFTATGSPEQQAGWRRVYEQAALTEAQRRLVGGFERSMHVLVVAGVWCGDCAQQCPLLARIAEANPRRVGLRFVDRDAHEGLSSRVRINGGRRVPVALFLAEDFEFVSMLGDRTLSRYRALAQRQLGPSCPVPGAPPPAAELAAVLQDWLNEFERVQLLLMLSPRLSAVNRPAPGD